MMCIARRLAAVAVVALLPVGAMSVTAVGPAAHAAQASGTSEEVYPVPADGRFVLVGHGWGHGVGLSQWGARNAATQHKTVDDILGFYYPSTSNGSLPAGTTERVVLTENGAEGYAPSQSSAGRYQCDPASGDLSVRCDLEVLPASGLMVQDMASGASLALPAGPDRWGVNVDAAGLHLLRHDAARNVWTAVSLGGRAAFAGPVRFYGPATLDMVYRDGSVREYAGELRAVDTTTGVPRLARVNVVSTESYLHGVVPRESEASWPVEALKSQAVAARTFAEYWREHSDVYARITGLSTSPWDICDSDYCQEYGGTEPGLQTTNVVIAIAATAGRYLRTDAGAIFAEFSASDGGWTADGGTPYLVAQPDPWDAGAPDHDWKGVVTAAQIQTRYPQLGRLTDVVVVQRSGNGDGGGRIEEERLEGTAGTVTLAGITSCDLLCSAHPYRPSSYSDGVRSNWWRIDPTSYTDPLVTGGTPAAVWSGRNQLDVFGLDAKGGVEDVRWLHSGGWGAAANLGGATVGHPSASRGPAGLQVYVRGTDGQLWTTTVVGVGGGGWTVLGGALSSSPAASSDGAGGQAVFVRATTGALYARMQHDGTWGRWTNLGGVLSEGSAPAVTSMSPGELTVVVHAVNGGLYSRELAGGRWGGWRDLADVWAPGSSPAGEPAIGSAGDGTAVVVVRDQDRAGSAAVLAGGRLGPWQRLGGVLAVDPGVAGGAAGRVDVLGWGTNARLYQDVRTAAGWSGWRRPF